MAALAGFVEHTACSMGLAAGVLHGASMAIRKYYGEGHKEYWRDPRWWLGVFMDTAGGSMFFFASAFLAAGALFVLAVGAQMATGFLLGVLFFEERATMVGKLGFVCMAFGCLALAMAEHGHAHNLTVKEFWQQLLSPAFLVVAAAWLLVVVGSFAFAAARGWEPKATALAYSFAAAFAEGVQFLPTRCLAVVILISWDWSALTLLPLGLKIACAVSYVHFQQLALDTHLHVIGSLYPVLTSLMSVTLAATMFSDHLELNAPTLMALLSAGLGIAVHALPAADAQDGELDPLARETDKVM